MHDISRWIKEYATKSGNKNLVVGVSGGVDSALVSTLCAETGLKTYVASIDVYSDQGNQANSKKMIDWLLDHYPNVVATSIDLGNAMTAFVNELPYRGESRSSDKGQLGFSEIKATLHTPLELHNNKLAEANTKSRLRMVFLYHLATATDSLVVGTGNLVEDFGVGFFTKYGDGGVDLSPIGHLYKSEVRQVADSFGIPDSIVNAIPTDGLWEGSRTDEDQIGASYEELEFIMQWYEHHRNGDFSDFTPRQKAVKEIYDGFHARNAHKMAPIPTYPN